MKKRPTRPLTFQHRPPAVRRILTLEQSAQRVVTAIEEALAAGAIRLPYAGLLEAVVDLKRALKR